MFYEIFIVKNSLVTRKKEKNFVLAVIKSDISDFIRGKFETLGSNFSHEIRITKLLASLLATKSFFFNIYLWFFKNSLRSFRLISLLFDKVSCN